MKIKKSEFIISATHTSGYPEEGYPEVAFAGRSNVGKSSLINLLTGRKKLAKISGKPGKTRLINFFRINDEIYFVDLPGYGYASVSRDMKEGWGKMMETYLEERETLKGVVLLVDIRHLPSKEDRQMFDYLKYYRIPVIIACTKGDKVSRGKRPHYMKKIREALEAKGVPILACSTLERNGVEELLGAIDNLIGSDDRDEK